MWKQSAHRTVATGTSQWVQRRDPMATGPPHEGQWRTPAAVIGLIE
jgi:hypothetical protein